MYAYPDSARYAVNVVLPEWVDAAKIKAWLLCTTADAWRKRDELCFTEQIQLDKSIKTLNMQIIESLRLSQPLILSLQRALSI